MNQYFKVGKFAATFGVEGQLIMQHSLGNKKTLKDLGQLFIEETKNSFIPFFIAAIKIKSGTEIYISLEGITTKEAARFLVKKDVWIQESDFVKFAASAAPISLLGFTILNDDQVIGEVSEVIEQDHQVLCTVFINGNEVLIPVHENSLQKIDKKNRKIYVSLPEGLLDIYK